MITLRANFIVKFYHLFFSVDRHHPFLNTWNAGGVSRRHVKENHNIFKNLKILEFGDYI